MDGDLTACWDGGIPFPGLLEEGFYYVRFLLLSFCADGPGDAGASSQRLHGFSSSTGYGGWIRFNYSIGLKLDCVEEAILQRDCDISLLL